MAHPPLTPVGAWITPSLLRTLCNPVSPSSKNIKHLTYEATPDSATVKKLCFQPAQAHPPEAVPPHPRLVEPQAPLHAYHAERKTKANVFEVG